MTQDQVTRFVRECESKRITITKTDRALLECFRQWFLYDNLVMKQKEPHE